ncbi:hypothetical protein RJ640_023552 [Escallonia rubra]|uniref:DHHA1 domain-containing protein n=1 Tax=Escallonia rubra TaxID=112253 RepID=A0AA88U2P9_9ASTE|nr:hypothetical protein RJ640_023552 [Escallonia rubra]
MTSLSTKSTTFTSSISWAPLALSTTSPPKSTGPCSNSHCLHKRTHTHSCSRKMRSSSGSSLRSVVVLDHHKTALETLEPVAAASNVDLVIDMGRSGATIAYDYFMKKLLNDSVDGGGDTARIFERVRPLFDYVEDGDLWRWRLDNSKAFSSGLKDLNIEFNARLNPSLFHQVIYVGDLVVDDPNILYRIDEWELDMGLQYKRRCLNMPYLLQLLSLDLESVINQGMASLLQKQTLISEVLKQSYEIALGGGAFGHCLAVTADSIPELRSELGHQLANKSCGMDMSSELQWISVGESRMHQSEPDEEGNTHDRNVRGLGTRRRLLRGIGAVVYRVPELDNDQVLKISLRSVGSEDTTRISQKYGGGGHRNASSFMLSSAEFEQWKVGLVHPNEILAPSVEILKR